MILTFLGRVQVLKGLMELRRAASCAMGLNRVSYERAWHFIVGSVRAWAERSVVVRRADALRFLGHLGLQSGTLVTGRAANLASTNDT